MQNSSSVADARHHKPASPRVAGRRKNVGRAVVILASLAFLALLLIQILDAAGDRSLPRICSGPSRLGLAKS